MTFKTYRATRKNSELLYKALTALGQEVEEITEVSWYWWRHENWFKAGNEAVNFKMQELAIA